jgi:hypothetical protein
MIIPMIIPMMSAGGANPLSDPEQLFIISLAIWILSQLQILLFDYFIFNNLHNFDELKLIRAISDFEINYINRNPR